MSSTASGAVAGLGRWLRHHPDLLPICILLAGAAFRFYNLDWDNSHQLHPDERWIFMVVSGASGAPMSWPSSASQFFNIARGTGSPLDPHFFAYGSLPFYLLALVAGAVSIAGQHVPVLSAWATVDSYGGLPMLGRGLSALLDLTSVALVFLLARRIYDYWTGVLAMALAAFTVLDIQLSHFYAVDTVLLPLVLATLLACVTIVQTSKRTTYLWAGMAFGAALATKTTALLLFMPLGGAAVLAAWYSAPFARRQARGEALLHHLREVAPELNLNLQWTLYAYVVAALVFVACEPYAVLDRAQLVQDISQQSAFLVTNNPPFSVPYTIQYANTLPYLYQLKNLLFWCLGIPLALAAFGGVLWALARSLRGRALPAEAILLLWVLPYFLFVGRFFAKFDRYMLPITPAITILGAGLLVWLARRATGWRLVSAHGAIALVTGLSLLYSLAYMNIYAHPNTRVAASRWIFSHIKPGTLIASEGAWDDPLPMDEQGHTGAQYPQQLQLNLYDPDDPTKLTRLADDLSRARYLIMSSERMIGSIPRLPDHYPMTVRYYNLLLAGRLGYRLVADFQAHPQLGPVVVQDYGADESFHVYDHPHVRIFERVKPIAAGHIQALLRPALAAVAGAAPDTRLMLSRQQWAADQRGPTFAQMFPAAGFGMQHPIVAWLLLLEILGLIALPFTVVVFRGLPDGGWGVAKMVGWLVLGYPIWLLVRLRAATYDAGLLWLVLSFLAVLAVASGMVLRQRIRALMRIEWRAVVGAELVFLGGFALFVLLRMWYPDLGHQYLPVSPSNIGGGRMGEKQMELAFLNAVVRSRVFPPYDPFFAHGYINYYYYGFYLVATLCKLTGIVPATGFNLAIATFFGLLLAGMYTVGLGITRRVGAGLLAALLTGIIGNLNGAWQAIQGLMSIADVQFHVPVLGGVVDTAAGLYSAVVEHRTLPAFDYWGPTRIVPPIGSPITEFPYFTYLFADLHPHLMAYPMTAAALALAVRLALSPLDSRQGALPSLLLGGLLLGAIAVTNPWDYPTYILVVALGAIVGVYALRRRLLDRSIVGAAGVVATMLAASWILYLPFQRNYQTVFASGIGLVRNVTPLMLQDYNVPADQIHDAIVTPLRIYIEHFGVALFAVTSYLIALLWTAAGLGERAHRTVTTLRFAVYYRDRLPVVWRAVRAARRMRQRREPVLDGSLLAGLLIVVVGLTLFGYYLLAFLTVLGGLAGLLLLRLGRHLSTSQLFVLVLLLVPVAISFATQIVYFKDFLAESPSFRMNTIFKFYNQAWVLYAACAACGLYYFMAYQVERRRRNVRRELPSRSRQIMSVASLRLRPAAGRIVPASHFALASGSAGSADLTAGAGETGGVPKSKQRWETPGWLRRPLCLLELRPLWSASFAVLLGASLVYTYAGTVSRETVRSNWLPAGSVPLTLDGMAFMRVAYPGDYAGIEWLNQHVHGAQVIAEADGAYYDWRSRVSMFTGLPSIVNGIHEDEQRYGDELAGRSDDVHTLYSSPDPAAAWRIIHRYSVRYIFVGFTERQCVNDTSAHQCYGRRGLAKFNRMVGHGLRLAFRRPGITIYEVVRT